MNERDMMYGGYNVNMPGNYSYGNFGFQGPPGSLPMYNGMMNAYDYNQGNMMNNQNNNPISALNSRINSLETRVKNLEQRVNKLNNNSSNNSYQEDNSIYML